MSSVSLLNFHFLTGYKKGTNNGKSPRDNVSIVHRGGRERIEQSKVNYRTKSINQRNWRIKDLL